MERVTAPGHACDIPWKNERTLSGRRSEWAFVKQLRHAFTAYCAVLGRGPPSILRVEALRRQRWRSYRKRLRRRGLLARHSAPRNRALFHRENRRAVIPIQHEKVAGLVALNHHWN